MNLPKSLIEKRDELAKEYAMTTDSGKKPREYTVFGGECNGFPTLLCDGPIPKINERILVREVTPCANCERLEASKHIQTSGMETEIQRLQKQLEMCKEALGFYANERSWGGYHRDVDTIMDDSSKAKASDDFDINLGGRRAREFLKKVDSNE